MCHPHNALLNRFALLECVCWAAAATVIVPLSRGVLTTSVPTLAPRKMCVGPTLSVKFNTSVRRARVRWASKQYPPPSKAASVFPLPVPPTTSVAPTLSVIMESATLSASKMHNVHRVKVVLMEYAKKFALETATAYRERCVLKALVYQAVAAILIVASTKSASRRNACVTRASCLA